MWYWIIWVLVTIGVIKCFNKLTCGVCISNTCLLGKTVLITGATSGIGYATALGFAARGAKVIIASRNANSYYAKRISDETGNPNIVALKLDLVSLKAVRHFAANILQTESKIDILVNNAAAVGYKNKHSEDGLQCSMAVNHFSSVLLTLLLVKALKKSDGARVIWVASTIALLHTLNRHADNLNKPYTHLDALVSPVLELVIYCNSKFCNLVSARKFGALLKKYNISTYAVNPGYVATPLFIKAGENYSPWYHSFFKWHNQIMPYLFSKKPIEGAQTTLYCALEKSLQNETGRYYSDCNHFFNPISIFRSDTCERIWDETIRLLQLTKEEQEIYNDLLTQ